MDPTTIAAISQGVGALGQGIGQAMGGPFMGGSSGASSTGHQLNGAGWVVNLGGTQVASASPTNTTMPTPAAAVAGLGVGVDMQTALIIAAVALVAVKLLRRK